VLPIDPDGSDLMSRDTKIGIVTAAGYTDAERYYGRLHGLLEAIKISDILTPSQKQNLVIMGKYSNSAKFGANDF
jgi:IMP and pyridine-specific 5'-nucleotidase